MLHSEPQQLSCPICYQPFDPSTNPSVIVCSNKHSICARCVGNLQSFKCPFCRGTINFGQAAVNQPNQAIVNRQYRYNPVVRQPVRNNRQTQSRFISKLKVVFEDLILIGTFINVPLLLFNLIFALRDSDPSCVDTRYNFILTARQYFLIMEIWGLVNASLIFVMLIARAIFNDRYSNILDPVVFFLLSGMVIFWVLMEPTLFFMIVRQHCQGDIHTYCSMQIYIIMVGMPIIGICKII